MQHLAVFVVTFASVASQSACDASVVEPPISDSSFTPISVAVADDGVIFVADAGSKTVQAYNADGSFRFAIDNSTFSNFASVASTAGGSLTVASIEGGSRARVASYNADGSLLYETTIAASGRPPSIAVGPDGLSYVSTGQHVVHRIDAAGVATVAYDLGRELKAIDFDSEGRLFGITYSDQVIGFNADGTIFDSFSVDQGLTSDERATSFTIANDLIYVTDNRSGTARAFTRSGEQTGVGYGVPLTNDLTATPDGRLFAAMPDARVVEQIGPERFEPGYGGVTRLHDRPPLFPDFYDRLLENDVDLDNGWSETTAPTFIVPGEAGEMVDLDFHFVANTGRSGVVLAYDVSEVLADPLEEPDRYFIEAIEALIGFVDAGQRPRCHLIGSCEGVSEPNLLATLSVAAGTDIGFLNYTGTWASSVASEPSVLEQLLDIARRPFHDTTGVLDPDYINFVTRGLEGRTTPAYLLSSDSRANWGRMDQFVSFLSDDETLIGVEDLNLAGESDAEFTDFMFRISTRLIPTPEPSTAALSLLSLQLAASLRIRRG